MAAGTQRALRAERDRAIRAQERDALRAMRGRIAQLIKDRVRLRAEQTRERKRLVMKLRQTLREVPKRDQGERRRQVLYLHTKRVEFAAWWREQLAERDRRKAEIAQARAELDTWRKGARERVAALRAELTEVHSDTVDALDEQQARDYAAATDAIGAARRGLARERADQAQYRRTAGRKAADAKRVTQAEKRAEFTGNVEANLTDALEIATWRRSRRQILEQARRQGVTAPDGVAEIVKEWTEADPGAAIEWLERDARKYIEQLQEVA